MKQLLFFFFFILIISGYQWSIAKDEVAQKNKDEFLDVSYGDDPQQKLDFWKAPGEGLRPIIIYIHGGGWINGDKKGLAKKEVDKYAALGISYAAINYRHVPAHLLPAPVHDAARAVQFIRTKAKEWNIDQNKIALTGDSAGACSSMWILLHDDLKDKNSKDPVLRESTRVCCAVIGAGQTSIDPLVIKEWIGPKGIEHPMIFKSVGAKSSEDAVLNYKNYEKLYKEFSPITHLDKNDPPLYMKYGKNLPADSVNVAIHHYYFGLKMKEASDKIGHECYLQSTSYDQKQKYLWEIDFFKGLLLEKK